MRQKEETGCSADHLIQKEKYKCIQIHNQNYHTLKSFCWLMKLFMNYYVSFLFSIRNQETGRNKSRLRQDKRWAQETACCMWTLSFQMVNIDLLLDVLYHSIVPLYLISGVTDCSFHLSFTGREWGAPTVSPLLQKRQLHTPHILMNSSDTDMYGSWEQPCFFFLFMHCYLVMTTYYLVILI